jgi:hypothetical protein
LYTGVPNASFSFFVDSFWRIVSVDGLVQRDFLDGISRISSPVVLYPLAIKTLAVELHRQARHSSQLYLSANADSPGKLANRRCCRQFYRKAMRKMRSVRSITSVISLAAFLVGSTEASMDSEDQSQTLQISCEAVPCDREESFHEMPNKVSFRGLGDGSNTLFDEFVASMLTPEDERGPCGGLHQQIFSRHSRTNSRPIKIENRKTNTALEWIHGNVKCRKRAALTPTRAPQYEWRYCTS